MILNLSKIKTEALLLFCRDLIGAYENSDCDFVNIEDDIKEYINNTIINLKQGINASVHNSQYYIDNSKNIRIKSILKSYEYINQNISEHLSKGEKFNPAMLCFSLLITWFSEFRYENKSKEFIFFTIFPYNDIYDKLLVNIKDIQYKQLNIYMIQIAEDVIIKLHNYSLKQ